VTRGATRLRGVVATAWLLLGLATAQPAGGGGGLVGGDAARFAAGGGFGRPVALAQLAAPLLALGSGPEPRVYVWHEGAIVAHSATAPDAAATTIASTPIPWALSAVGSGGADLLAWSWRDLSDGAHVVAGVEGILLRGRQPLQPVGVAAGEGARWFALSADGDGSHVVELEPGGTLRRLYTTPLRLASLSAASDADGALHVTWLEGFTESGPLGGRARWSAYGASLDASRLSPTELGRSEPGTMPTATAASATGGIVRAWTGADGQVRRSDRAEPLGPGRVLGATSAGAVFVAVGDRIVRYDAAGGAAAVAWSPVTIAGGAALRNDAGATDLAWWGTRAGGERVAFVASDRVAFTPNLRDRLAAAFGWSPWTLLEEAAGQVASSLLAAILAASAAFPLLALLAPIATRSGSVAAGARRGAFTGGVLVAVVLSVVALLGGAELAWAAGGIATLTAIVGGGAMATWLVAPRDLERSAAFTLAASVAVTIAVAVIAFAGFRSFSAFVGFGGGGAAW
jgi:hypothetical protein